MPLQQIAINFPPIPVFSVQTDSFVSATFLRYAKAAENIPTFSENLQKNPPQCGNAPERTSCFCHPKAVSESGRCLRLANRTKQVHLFFYLCQNCFVARQEQLSRVKALALQILAFFDVLSGSFCEYQLAFCVYIDLCNAQRDCLCDLIIRDTSTTVQNQRHIANCFLNSSQCFKAQTFPVCRIYTRQDITSNVTSDQINSATKLVSTYSIIIKSDTVLQQVIDNLGLSLTYQQLASRVTVSAVDDTQVMKVTVKSDNPEWARQVCEQITVVSPDVILESVEAGSVKVISNAAINPTPVSPNVGRNTMLGGVLGLVISVGIILLTVLLDNKIHTEDDVAKYLDLAVVGVIPEYQGGKKK